MTKGNCHYCEKKNILVTSINYFYGIQSMIPTHNNLTFNICESCHRKEESELKKRRLG